MQRDFVPYADLYPWIMPELPGCPAPLIDLEIWNALRDWCRETHAWNIVLDPLPIRANRSVYPIDNPYPDDSIPWSLMYVERNGRRLRPGVEYTNTIEDVTLTTIPAQDEAKALVFRIAFDVKPGSTNIPICLFNAWGNKIAIDAKSRLMLQPAKTWTNPQMGAAYRVDAYNERVNAKIKVMNEMSTNQEARVRPGYRFA